MSSVRIVCGAGCWVGLLLAGSVQGGGWPAPPHTLPVQQTRHLLVWMQDAGKWVREKTKIPKRLVANETFGQFQTSINVNSYLPAVRGLSEVPSSSLSSVRLKTYD
jgi:hypothetical protein